jgi:hypothetical protein
MDAIRGFVRSSGLHLHCFIGSTRKPSEIGFTDLAQLRHSRDNPHIRHTLPDRSVAHGGSISLAGFLSPRALLEFGSPMIEIDWQSAIERAMIGPQRGEPIAGFRPRAGKVMPVSRSISSGRSSILRQELRVLRCGSNRGA